VRSRRRLPSPRRPNSPPPEAKILGRRIRTLRAERGWSQLDLAAETDFERAYIGGIEIGQRNLTLKNLLRFARAFRIPLSELVDGLR